MPNPWEEISLSDYEKHMSLDSVKQLQVMNDIMKEQFADYPVHTAMVLGIAGGNGLEHVDREKYKIVYGVDVNAGYLKEVEKRYTALDGILKCLHLNLLEESDDLPHADLMIANLLIEYVGYPAFQKAIQKVCPQYVSCVIQINTDKVQWVSDSPYIHAFDGLDEVHHQMEEKALIDVMDEIGYEKILQDAVALPNGKHLVRIDFRRKT